MRNKLRNFDKARRKYTAKMEHLFYKAISFLAPAEEKNIPINEVKKILILRNNCRIGNMYFLLPFIRSTQEYFANVKIDIMVKNENQKQVFENLDLNNIICSNFSIKTFFSFLSTIIKLRKNKYDIIFMPYCSSTDSIIASFLFSRNKISFNNKYHNEIFKNIVNEENKNPHIALSSISILHSLGYKNKNIAFQIKFTKNELDFGETKAKSIKGNKNLLIGYFRGARGKKIISDTSWKDIISKINIASNDSIQWVEILSPDITTPLITEHASFKTKNLRELGALLANVDLFFCADTGPLHLANAAEANCVGLFNVTSSKTYGCLGENALNIDDIEGLDPTSILNYFGLQKAPLHLQSRA